MKHQNDKQNKRVMYQIAMVEIIKNLGNENELKKLVEDRRNPINEELIDFIKENYDKDNTTMQQYFDLYNKYYNLYLKK